MQSRVGEKYGGEQILRESGVDLYAFFNDIAKFYASFYDDDGTYSAAGKPDGRTGKGFDGLAVVIFFAAEEQAEVHAGKCLPYVLVEEDDDNKEERAEHVLEKPYQSEKAEYLCACVQGQQGQQAVQGSHGACAAHKADAVVAEHGYYEYVQKVAPADRQLT